MIYHRRVIRITAADSPNVRLAMMQQARGQRPTNQQVLPGVLSWQEYQSRRLTWDAVRQCVGLDAQFYQGAELLLWPPQWLNAAERRAEQLGRDNAGRVAKAIGVDPAEGGDRTAVCVIDQLGVLELVSVKTPDTSVTPKQVMAMMLKWGVPPDRVCFDRGGGGKQHSDAVNAQLRTRGHRGGLTRTVAFGESLVLELRRGLRLVEERRENVAERYEYVNRRAQMYHELSLALDPGLHSPSGPDNPANEYPFAIPPGSWGEQFSELRRQMAVVPKEYDEEGRLRLRAKHRKPGAEEQHHKTLTELIGHSPDELDALALAYHALTHRSTKPTAGAI